MDELLEQAQRRARLAMSDDQLARDESIQGEMRRLVYQGVKVPDLFRKNATPIESVKAKDHRENDVEDQSNQAPEDFEKGESDIPTDDDDPLRNESKPSTPQARSPRARNPQDVSRQIAKTSREFPSPAARAISQSSSQAKASPQSQKSSPGRASKRVSLGNSPSKTSKRAKPLVVKPAKNVWQGGSVFVVPRGQDITMGLKKTLDLKVINLGGTIASSADLADLVVVGSCGVTNQILEKEFFKRKSSTKGKVTPTLVTLEWLRFVVSKEQWIDPTSNESYLWKEFDPTGGDAFKPPSLALASTQATESQSMRSTISQDLKRDDSWLESVPPRYRSIAESLDTLEASPSASSLGSPGRSATLDEFATNKPTWIVASTSAATAAAAAPSVGAHGGQIYLNRKRPIPKETLACQKLPQVVKSEPLNQLLISELGKMAELNEAKGDQWRAKSYSQAVAILRTLDFEVTKSEQIRHRKGFGKNMCAHIDEILTTGKMEKRVHFESDPFNQALVNLKRIYGVGEEWAFKLAKLGFTDIASVRRALDAGDDRLKLNRAQHIGVKHYEDLQVRMKRAEMESILNFVKQGAEHVYGKEICAELVMEIVGSYRRGKESSGDIDIIITSPRRQKERLSIPPLIRFLQREGLISDVLTISIDARDRKRDWSLELEEALEEEKQRESFFVPPTSENEPESETFMGVCCLSASFPHSTGIHRRIDIKSYPAETFAFALLYFTGSAHFNRSMRYYAKSIGYSLSDKGMYPCTRFSRDKVLKGASIECRTEQDIFEALGLEYRHPKDRNCDEIIVMSGKNEVTAAASTAAEIADEDGVDDDEAEQRESSEDELEDGTKGGRLPPHFCESIESLDEFLLRLSPSSYLVRSPWIRIWAPFDVDAGPRFDALDHGRTLRGLKATACESPGKLSLKEAETVCEEFGCLSGKWTILVRREEVDPVWSKLSRFIVDPERNASLLIIGAKVNSIAFRKRKHHASTMFVYTRDFRDKDSIAQVLSLLRGECGIGGQLKYRSEAMSCLMNVESIWVSDQALHLAPAFD